MDTNIDTLILGGGVFGLACARELARTGRRVSVVDRGMPGCEASGLALGRIDPFLQGWSPSGKYNPSNLSRAGVEADLAIRSWRLHMERRAELEDISGIDFQTDYRPTLHFIQTEEELIEAEICVRRWGDLGYEVKIIEAEEVRNLDSRYKAGRYGTLYMVGSFFLDSLLFSKALHTAAKMNKVNFIQGNVQRMDYRRGMLVVHTDTEMYRAPEVVIALGAWSSDFCRVYGVNVPISSSRGQILRLTLPSGGPFHHHLHGASSLILKKDGEVWVAATAEDAGNTDFDSTPTEAARLELMQNAAQLMEGVDTCDVIRQTVCFRPVSPDGLPVIGRLPVGGKVWIASGGSGTGILHSLLVASETAKMIDDEETSPRISAISLARFQRKTDDYR